MLDKTSNYRETLTHQALQASGIEQNVITRYRTEIVVFLILLTVIFGIIGNLIKKDGPDISSIFISIPATFAFSIAYWQWRSGTHEISFDNYFTKVKEVNSLFSAYQVERIRATSSTVANSGTETVHEQLQTMFNFGELDTLEYMLGKLRLGYVRQDLAERVVRSFVSRCIENRDDFRGGMLHWVGASEGQERAGYEVATRKLVRFVVNATNEHYPTKPPEPAARAA